MTKRIGKPDIDRALRAAREAGLTIVRLTVDHDAGRVVVETAPVVAKAPVPLDQVEYG